MMADVEPARASSGPTDFGNFEANTRFLEMSGVLRPESEILEVGSGTGNLLRRLIDKGHRARGVEINPELIAEGRRWHGDLPIQAVDGIHLPFPDASFDVVLSFDVFEHIPDSDGHLAEVRRVLRPGGYYLMQTPNKWTNVVFETIRWRSFTKFRKDHCSLHTLRQLTTRLQRHGFTADAFDVPVVNDFFRAKVRRHLGALGVRTVTAVNPDRLPLWLRTNLYVRAQKLS
jgi:SAM-dependent methyltransferase